MTFWEVSRCAANNAYLVLAGELQLASGEEKRRKKYVDSYDRENLVDRRLTCPWPTHLSASHVWRAYQLRSLVSTRRRLFPSLFIASPYLSQFLVWDRWNGPRFMNRALN